MEDPYLAKILKNYSKETIKPTNLREKSMCTKKEPLYTEIKGSDFFAKAMDKFGEYHYLSADSEEAIESYCEGGIISDSMAICNWINYVDPIQICFHFL